jgi:hypothetical protein
MKTATETIAEMWRDKNLNLIAINHCIYVASKVIGEEINETETIPHQHNIIQHVRELQGNC